jgi:hypothetical protein
LRDLWTSAGLGDIHTRVITVERTYTDFDDLWTTVLGGPSAGQALAVMGEADVSRFRELLRERLQPAGSGSISLTGRAHAIRGTVPSRQSLAALPPDGAERLTPGADSFDREGCAAS